MNAARVVEIARAYHALAAALRDAERADTEGINAIGTARSTYARLPILMDRFARACSPRVRAELEAELVTTCPRYRAMIQQGSGH